MYQNKSYDNFNFEIQKIPTLIFKAQATFDGNLVTLNYSKQATGNCSCKGHLCRHEICLFFLLRDKLNEIFLNKQSEELFYTRVLEDEFMQELMEINIYKNIYKYKITPLLEIKNNNILFSLKLNYKNLEETFTDVLEFLNLVQNKSEIDLNQKKKAILEHKYFDDASKRLIDLLELARDNLEVVEGSVVLPSELLNYFYYEHVPCLIQVSQNRYRLKFVDSFPPFKINVENKKIYTERSDYKTFITKSDSYVFIYNNVYVIHENDMIYAKLLEKLSENSNQTLNDSTLEIFLNNFYPLYYDHINYDYFHKKEDIHIDTYLTLNGNHSLTLKYDGDFDDDTFYLKKKNYKILIRELGFKKANDYTITDLNQVMDIIENKLNLFKEYGTLFVSENIEKIQISNLSKSRLSFKLDDSILKLSFDNMQYTPDELYQMVLSYKKGDRYFETEDKEIVKLDDSLLEFETLSQDMKENIIDPNNIPLYQAYYLSNRYKDVMNTNEILNNFSRDLINYSKASYEIPSVLKANLREYQENGFKWLRTLYNYHLGGVLADDMGIGKTLEIISLISSMEENTKVLIVSPTSLIFNWNNEFEKFNPQIKRKVLYGDLRSNKVMHKLYEENQVLITSYEALRVDVENYSDLNFDVMVIDEAQFIKNPDALKTVAVKKINAQCKFALTGTPIENSILDLWSIFDFILPSYLQSKNKFIKKYEDFMNPVLLEELNKKITPFILRRLKGDVLSIPEKVSTTTYSVMSEEERKVYDKYLLDIRTKVSEDNYSIRNVLSYLTTLRELACEPKLVLDTDNKNSKMDMLIEIIEEKIYAGHKILVFSQFTSVFKFIEKRLKESNIKFLKLTGETDPKKRIELVNEYNSNEDIKVFLISLKAGGTGLNLTSADTIIHYDPWWNMAAMNQATDRAHRMGQTRTVHEIKLVNKDTIEEKIIELEEKKLKLTKELINDSDFISRLTIEDIKSLFM